MATTSRNLTVYTLCGIDLDTVSLITHSICLNLCCVEADSESGAAVDRQKSMGFQMRQATQTAHRVVVGRDFDCTEEEQLVSNIAKHSTATNSDVSGRKLGWYWRHRPSQNCRTKCSNWLCALEKCNVLLECDLACSRKASFSSLVRAFSAKSVYMLVPCQTTDSSGSSYSSKLPSYKTFGRI